MNVSMKCEHCGAEDGFENATDEDAADGDSDDCIACGFPSNLASFVGGSWAWVSSRNDDAFCDDDACVPCRAVVARFDADRVVEGG